MEFWDFNLGVMGEDVIWMWALWRSTEYTIRGWWLPANSSRGESYEFEFARGSF
jgi:hypothetical protein